MKTAFSYFSKNAQLNGIVDSPSGPGAPFIVYVPGVSGGALSKKTEPMAEAFVRAGFTFIRFEFRSYAKPDSFLHGSLNEDVDDIRNAISYLSRTFWVEEFFVVAKSFGGLRALLAMHENVSAFGFLAPAIFMSETSTVENLLAKPYGQIERVEDFKIEKSEREKWRSPTIVVHGDRDEVVPISNSESLLSFIPNNVPKKLSVIAWAGHSFDGKNQLEAAVADISDFFRSVNWRDWP